LGAWRSSWRLLRVFGISPNPPWVFSLHSWWFSPLFGVEEENGCELEMETRMGGVIGAWSSCQEP